MAMNVQAPAGREDASQGPPQVHRLTLDADWDAYVAKRRPSPANARRWLAALRAFEKHMGRIELATVTGAEIKSWIETLLGSGMSMKTVAGVYIPALTFFIAWAASEGKIEPLKA